MSDNYISILAGSTVLLLLFLVATSQPPIKFVSPSGNCVGALDFDNRFAQVVPCDSLGRKFEVVYVSHEFNISDHLANFNQQEVESYER